MKKLRVYEYEKCSTCKKALKFLDQAKVPYDRVSIVDHPPNLNELKQMLGYYQGDIRKLFNTSGVAYREMGLSQKIDTLSVDDALKLLVNNGKLVKRPFVLSDQHGRVGFNESEWKKLLTSS